MYIVLVFIYLNFSVTVNLVLKYVYFVVYRSYIYKYKKTASFKQSVNSDRSKTAKIIKT